jgi:hypothetical protein
MFSFLFGAVAGALAATYWRSDLNRLRSDRMPEWRQRAADRVEDLERAAVGSIGKLSGRARSALRSERSAARGGDATSAPGEGPRLG